MAIAISRALNIYPISSLLNVGRKNKIPLNVSPGKTNWKGRLSTVDLLIKYNTLYYKTLRTRNVREMDSFRNKLVHCNIDHKHIN